jgi:general secretion pathway protein D
MLVMRRALAVALAASGLALAGCANFPALKLPPAETPRKASASASLPAVTAAGARPDYRAAANADDIAALVPADRIDVELPPQPLPQMLNTVFGDILKVSYVLGPDVGARTDIVTLRGAEGMTKRDLFRMVQASLKSYGLKVVIHDRTVEVVTDAMPNQSSPVVLNGRAGPEPPQSAQPVTEYVDAKSIDIKAGIALMADIYPKSRVLTLAVDERSNSVMITGGARDVTEASGLLRELDQAKFAGVGVVRFQPIYWSAETLAKSLEDTLSGEGYSVSGSPQQPRSILVVAFPGPNQVLMFAKDPALLARAQEWVGNLDQPQAIGNKQATFIYQAENTDAEGLADLVETPGGASGGGRRPEPTGLAGTPPAAITAANLPGPADTSSALGGLGGSLSPAGHAGSFLNGRMIVDQPGNRILFTGLASEFTELRKLLVALDTPQRQVLVEVTIAEVTLTDQTNLGLEWFFTHSMSGGTLSGGTLGGLGIGSTGLSLNYKGMNLQTAFNAFASNNKVNILSRPRLVARSGAEANIQVGTDVPIITSQTNAPIQTGGNTNILQSIQYRQTGTILHIKPLVYGDDRVDLIIGQEVSSEEANPNTAIGSPLILDRTITTQLSLADGATAVLGGLMDDDYTKGNSGIPILKDIPLLGSAFRTDTISGNKTELVMLVTPYILHEGDDVTRWTNRYRSEMNAAYKVGYGWSYTLTAYAPWVGLKAPRADP